MSASGGFYKYRCKYFYGRSCQNWVYVNGEACPSCLVSFHALDAVAVGSTMINRRTGTIDLVRVGWEWETDARITGLRARKSGSSRGLDLSFCSLS